MSKPCCLGSTIPGYGHSQNCLGSDGYYCNIHYTVIKKESSMKPIYLIVGAPGSGKSWVCNQLTNEFEYIPHDLYPKGYIDEVLKRVKTASKPLLIETPFSVSKIVDPLNAKGFSVVPVFIIETPEVTTKRYEAREGKPIPQGHLTRIETYKQRAQELKAFQGTSNEVLNHLISKASYHNCIHCNPGNEV